MCCICVAWSGRRHTLAFEKGCWWGFTNAMMGFMRSGRSGREWQQPGRESVYRCVWWQVLLLLASYAHEACVEQEARVGRHVVP